MVEAVEPGHDLLHVGGAGMIRTVGALLFVMVVAALLGLAERRRDEG